MGYILDDLQLQLGLSSSSGAKSGANFGSNTITGGSDPKVLIFLALAAVAVFVLWLRRGK